MDFEKLAAQHAMDSITRSTIWRLTSQEQHMEKEADGFYDGSQASAHRLTMPDVTPLEHGSCRVEVATDILRLGS